MAQWLRHDRTLAVTRKAADASADQSAVTSLTARVTRPPNCAVEMLRQTHPETRPRHLGLTPKSSTPRETPALHDSPQSGPNLALRFQPCDFFHIEARE